MSTDDDQAMTPFAYVWQYMIDPNCRVEFLDAYRPGGAWTRLFARDPNYLSTTLLQDVSDPDRYLTIDYWVSRQTRDSFQRTYREEFDALDLRCADFTVQEVLVGDFESVADLAEASSWRVSS